MNMSFFGLNETFKTLLIIFCFFHFLNPSLCQIQIQQSSPNGTVLETCERGGCVLLISTEVNTFLIWNAIAGTVIGLPLLVLTFWLILTCIASCIVWRAGKKGKTAGVRIYPAIVHKTGAETFLGNSAKHSEPFSEHTVNVCNPSEIEIQCPVNCYASPVSVVKPGHYRMAVKFFWLYLLIFRPGQTSADMIGTRVEFYSLDTVWTNQLDIHLNLSTFAPPQIDSNCQPCKILTDHLASLGISDCMSDSKDLLLIKNCSLAENFCFCLSSSSPAILPKNNCQGYPSELEPAYTKCVQGNTVCCPIRKLKILNVNVESAKPIVKRSVSLEDTLLNMSVALLYNFELDASLKNSLSSLVNISEKLASEVWSNSLGNIFLYARSVLNANRISEMELKQDRDDHLQNCLDVKAHGGHPLSLEELWADHVSSHLNGISFQLSDKIGRWDCYRNSTILTYSWKGHLYVSIRQGVLLSQPAKNYRTQDGKCARQEMDSFLFDIAINKMTDIPKDSIKCRLMSSPDSCLDRHLTNYWTALSDFPVPAEGNEIYISFGSDLILSNSQCPPFNLQIYSNFAIISSTFMIGLDGINKGSGVLVVPRLDRNQRFIINGSYGLIPKTTESGEVQVLTETDQLWKSWNFKSGMLTNSFIIKFPESGLLMQDLKQLSGQRSKTTGEFLEEQDIPNAVSFHSASFASQNETNVMMVNFSYSGILLGMVSLCLIGLILVMMVFLCIMVHKKNSRFGAAANFTFYIKHQSFSEIRSASGDFLFENGVILSSDQPLNRYCATFLKPNYVNFFFPNRFLGLLSPFSGYGNYKTNRLAALNSTKCCCFKSSTAPEEIRMELQEGESRFGAPQKLSPFFDGDLETSFDSSSCQWKDSSTHITPVLTYDDHEQSDEVTYKDKLIFLDVSS